MLPRVLSADWTSNIANSLTVSVTVTSPYVDFYSGVFHEIDAVSLLADKCDVI